MNVNYHKSMIIQGSKSKGHYKVFLKGFLPAVFLGVVDVCVETVTHPNVHFTSRVHEMIFFICTCISAIDSLMRI